MPTTPRPADFKLTGLIGTLRCCQLFTGVSGEDLAAIASFTLVQSLAKDDYLFHEGEPARGFYLMQSGAVNVHRVSGAGKEQVIHVFRPGESFPARFCSSRRPRCWNSSPGGRISPCGCSGR
jgi:signal-transduction protein with cAMP-binding, CBS, and nucleotidyltransferase domain